MQQGVAGAAHFRGAARSRGARPLPRVGGSLAAETTAAGTPRGGGTDRELVGALGAEQSCCPGLRVKHWQGSAFRRRGYVVISHAGVLIFASGGPCGHGSRRLHRYCTAMYWEPGGGRGWVPEVWMWMRMRVCVCVCVCVCRLHRLQARLAAPAPPCAILINYFRCFSIGVFLLA